MSPPFVGASLGPHYLTSDYRHWINNNARAATEAATYYCMRIINDIKELWGRGERVSVCHYWCPGVPHTQLCSHTGLHVTQCYTVSHCHEGFLWPLIRHSTANCGLHSCDTPQCPRILSSDWLRVIIWPEFWPLIGWKWSHDHNTGLWLAESDHMTIILASDRLKVITWP